MQGKGRCCKRVSNRGAQYCIRHLQGTGNSEHVCGCSNSCHPKAPCAARRHNPVPLAVPLSVPSCAALALVLRPTQKCVHASTFVEARLGMSSCQRRARSPPG